MPHDNRLFAALDDFLVYVRGTDTKLWRERDNGANRDFVDDSVASFQPMDSSYPGLVYVLGDDGNLWREWGDKNSREPVDSTAVDFQAMDDRLVYVLGNDYKLWRERGNWTDRDFVDGALGNRAALSAAGSVRGSCTTSGVLLDGCSKQARCWLFSLPSADTGYQGNVAS